MRKFSQRKDIGIKYYIFCKQQLKVKGKNTHEPDVFASDITDDVNDKTDFYFNNIADVTDSGEILVVI